MRLKITTLILLISVLFFSFAKIMLSSPEQIILGNWNESMWKYERAANVDHKMECDGKLSPDVISHLGRDLVLHESEKWDFKPNGQLHITSSTGSKRYFIWRIKGKGDVLQINSLDNQMVEHYKITNLNSDTLKLTFELDIQVKGLASLTFSR